MNILTPSERAARDHRLDCPPDKYDADDGDARRCTHGVWFIYKITERSGERGQGGYAETGKWRPATPVERRRIRKMTQKGEESMRPMTPMEQFDRSMTLWLAFMAALVAAVMLFGVMTGAFA